MTGKLVDPEVRRQRAAEASRATHSVDTLIRALVRRAPQLTDEQIETLRPILANADGGA